MQAVCEVTTNAVNRDEQSSVLPSIQFWISICEKEIEFQRSEHNQSHLIEKALPLLVPILLEKLLKQDEDQYQVKSIWNLSSAVATSSLDLMLSALTDEITHV